MARCWFHRWGKWSEPLAGNARDAAFGIDWVPVWLQRRCCERCGLIDYRKVCGRIVK